MYVPVQLDGVACASKAPNLNWLSLYSAHDLAALGLSSTQQRAANWTTGWLQAMAS